MSLCPEPQKKRRLEDGGKPGPVRPDGGHGCPLFLTVGTEMFGWLCIYIYIYIYLFISNLGLISTSLFIDHN